MKNKTLLMVLISILLMTSISCQMLTDLLPSGSTNPGSFTASATSPVSVQLTWSAVAGAQKYLVERNDAQTQYLAVSEVPGETTSFEDFLVPPNTQLTYRIKTMTASGTSDGKTVSLTTPREVANPLTVAATFDIAAAQNQAIGPDGGSMSLTDSRGVRYTLDIPAGALDNEVTFTLTPIQEIQGLPLSGGMTSGVRIEPEGLTLNEPATLSIETTSADAADGMTNMAFAFDGAGSEFHFVPGSSPAGTSAVFKLARPANKSKMKWITVPKTRSYGDGKGTSKDIRDQVTNHAPTSPADNLNQKMAAANDSTVTRFVDLFLLSSGREVELQVAGASGWLEFSVALETFKSWLEDRDAHKDTLKKDQLDKREEAIWEELVNEAVALIDKTAKDCKKSPKITTNLVHAKQLVNQLLNGTSPFYKKFAGKMHKYSYQETALKNMKAFLDQCTPGYKAYWEDQGGVWSGVVCSLDRPFTIMFLSPDGKLLMPFKFVPTGTSAEVGTVSFDATAFGTHWAGNGPYAVQGSGTEKPSLVGTIVGSYETRVQNGFYPVKFDIPLTPLETNECGQP